MLGPKVRICRGRRALLCTLSLCTYSRGGMAQSVTPYALLKQHLTLIFLPESAWNISVPNSLAAYLRRSNGSIRGSIRQRRQRHIPGRLHTGVKHSSKARGVGKLLYLDSWCRFLRSSALEDVCRERPLADFCEDEKSSCCNLRVQRLAASQGDRHTRCVALWRSLPSALCRRRQL